MIHDAQVEVTCDGKNCSESIYVDLPAGARNTYLAEDSRIEKEVVAQDWLVKDGQHFCCEECRKSIFAPSRKEKR